VLEEIEVELVPSLLVPEEASPSLVEPTEVESSPVVEEVVLVSEEWLEEEPGE